MKCTLLLLLGIRVVSATAKDPTIAAERCTDLAESLNLENTTVWFAESVEANAKISFPDNHPSCQRPSQHVDVALCRVALLTVTSSSPLSNISLEAWLPQNWNGRFLSTGNGGLSGCIQYEDMAYGISQGFATVGANNGHNGTSGAPFYRNPGVVEDFVRRSVHLGTVIGKQILKSYYDQGQSKSYYLGCSTGGRQGFKEAQEFPDDFDGFVVGAPAFAFNNLTSWSGSFYTITGPPNSPFFLDEDQWALVSGDVLAQCDGYDGAIDGIIEDPNLCQYRPERLLCGNESKNCLTSAQVQTVRSIFSDLHGEDGTLVYPRLQPGGNPGFLASGTPFNYTEDWYRYVIHNDLSWDPATLGPEDYAAAAALNPFDAETWKGDLSGVRDRGAKIIHYHGLEDPLISSDNSQRYYNHVARSMNLRSNEMDEFYRYFRISGMAHCSGGSGAWRIGNGLDSVTSDKPEENVLWAIVKWVEAGVAPEFIQGSGSKGNATVSRRHCKYPLRGVYTGEGDLSEPDSWQCV